MNDPANHQCPVSGCAAEVGAPMLMCRPHWYMVPLSVRDAVWLAWRRGEGAGTVAHAAACTAAINAVNRKLAAP